MLNPESLNKVHQTILAEYDRRIMLLEADLARLQEERREYINRNNLNKE